ncbi:hypothetical protein V1517DRAFT_329370 [Lipomyces orientalis]|uniref:Uncharacterized protein n=1 Tax=Lipomyces orientalis TaxID=1233043 RepID=A0ACC3THG5_9ASCO
MLLEGAVVLIVGSTADLDFIILQLISSRCRVYISGRSHESASFQRAKSRLHDVNLVYLTEDSESYNSDSDENERDIEDIMHEFVRRESRLDLIILSSASNEEKSVRCVLPTLVMASKQRGSSNIIVIKSVLRRPRTRMDSLKRVKLRPPEDEEERHEEDDHAEVVKEKLVALVEDHGTENIFVNATNPDLLLSIILQCDAKHHLPSHSTTVMPTSSVSLPTTASSV